MLTLERLRPRSPWMALPIGAKVRLADDCPFRNNILFAVPINEGAGYPQILPGLKSPLPFSLDTPSWKPSINGGGLEATDIFATNTVRTASQNQFAGLTGITYSSLINFTTLGNYYHAVRQQTAFIGHRTEFGDGTSGNIKSVIVDSGGTWREVQVNTVPTGTYSCVVTWSAAANTIAAYYLNLRTGVIYSNSASAGSASSIGSSSTNLALLGNETPGEAWRGSIRSVCFLNRGVSASEALGILLNPNQFFEVVGLPFGGEAAAGGDVSVALTGAAATYSQGTLVPSTSTALSGQAATYSQGTVTPSVSLALSGEAATYTAGTLTPDTAAALAGEAATYAAGSVTPSASVALTGLEAVYGQGTMTVPGDVTVALTGLAATYAQGTLTVTVGGVPVGRGKAKRKRRALDTVEGNRDFTGRRNSRPGVVEEEIADVLAMVKSRQPRVVPDDDEDDDEEVLMWVL